MRILFDHCVPSRLRDSLVGHEIRTTREMDWEELANGSLLREAAASFDVFLTVDRKIRHEQNLSTLPIAIIIVLVRSNRLVDLLPCVPAIERALNTLVPRRLVEVLPPAE